MNRSIHLIAPEAWEGRNPRSRAGGKEEVNTVLHGIKKSKQSNQRGESTVELAVSVFTLRDKDDERKGKEDKGVTLSGSLDTCSGNQTAMIVRCVHIQLRFLT